MKYLKKILFKKIEIWVLVLLLIVNLFIFIFYGHLVFDHYRNNQIFKNNIHRYLVWSSEIPSKIFNYFKYIDGYNGFVYETPQGKNSSYNLKPRFQRYAKPIQNNEILLMAIYDFKRKHGVVNVVDLNNFEIIFSYNHDPIIHRKFIKNFSEFDLPRLKNSATKGRTFYSHPLVLSNGDIISHNWGLLFRADMCGRTIWVNDDDEYGHSITQDHEGYIWVGSDKKPYSELVKDKLPNYKEYHEGAINKIDPKTGKLIYSKSVAEIMYENNLAGDNIYLQEDPFHDNDIEPALFNSKYFKKGDLFISVRNQNVIIQYDHKTNKVLRAIRGPFSGFHDPDIISDEEIAIFNNNVIPNHEKYSEILIYNLRMNKFKKIYENKLNELNMKSFNNGLADYSKNGSILVEETNGGRLLYFNKNGLEWEFININEEKKNRPVYAIFWSRLLDDSNLIENLKNKYKNFKKEQCINLEK